MRTAVLDRWEQASFIIMAAAVADYHVKNISPEKIKRKVSTAARERGCLGAVVDGGVRDVPYIDEMQFPVFAKFKCAASSVGRWNIRQWQVPVKIGDTVICPGDFVFCDTDGVVVVPKDIITEVLVDAESVFAREGGMRRELRQGVPITEAYKKYGSL